MVVILAVGTGEDGGVLKTRGHGHGWFCKTRIAIAIAIAILRAPSSTRTLDWDMNSYRVSCENLVVSSPINSAIFHLLRPLAVRVWVQRQLNLSLQRRIQ